MTTSRARGASLAAPAALALLLALLLLAPAASAASAAPAPVPPAGPAAGTPRLAACNVAGSRQPGDTLLQTRVEASGRFIGQYAGYTITKVEVVTVLGTPLCMTIIDRGPGTDRVSLTMEQLIGTIRIFAKRN
ncbi:hypothetical protein AB0469_29540 [Streptomyces sp. NPDC093801]|uniref:hypothetical protein n=1 Tax=Streptomyces sp. NPDC093801 TaxID=3155203 RepID=UPI00344D7CC1